MKTNRFLVAYMHIHDQPPQLLSWGSFVMQTITKIELVPRRELYGACDNAMREASRSGRYVPMHVTPLAPE